jgi:CheY-like chemotaxis protein
VEDSGIGISQEQQTAIFDHFTQADSSTTRKFGGTGLGLSITKQYVELLGGRISVDSSIGNGAVFLIEIPISEARETHLRTSISKNVLVIDEDPLESKCLSDHLRIFGCSVTEYSSAPPASLDTIDAAYISTDVYERTSREHWGSVHVVIFSNNAESSIERPHVSLPPTVTRLIEVMEGYDAADHAGSRMPPISDTPLKVLVAEDITINQNIVSAMLTQLGHDVLVVSNGQQACDAVFEWRPDVVLMDCQMPVMDGYQATCEIRNRLAAEPNGSPLRIVALTAGDTLLDQERAFRAGMDAFLQKPFTLDALSACLGEPTESSEEIVEVASEAHEDQIVDDRVIQQLFRLASDVGNVNLLSELHDGFRSQMREMLADLDKQAKSPADEDVRKIGHALKSMCANIGALRAREIAATIESSHAILNSKSLKVLSVQLTEAVADFDKEFERIAAR